MYVQKCSARLAWYLTYPPDHAHMACSRKSRHLSNSSF
uniref:Uncharacterized protein n=1 Tax=Arundo donax TaxID=35708 RepID=A0A0A9G1C2_ARUDO